MPFGATFCGRCGAPQAAAVAAAAPVYSYPIAPRVQLSDGTPVERLAGRGRGWAARDPRHRDGGDQHLRRLTRPRRQPSTLHGQLRSEVRHPAAGIGHVPQHRIRIRGRLQLGMDGAQPGCQRDLTRHQAWPGHGRGKQGRPASHAGAPVHGVGASHRPMAGRDAGLGPEGCAPRRPGWRRRRLLGQPDRNQLHRPHRCGSRSSPRRVVGSPSSSSPRTRPTRRTRQTASPKASRSTTCARSSAGQGALRSSRRKTRI